MTPVAEKLAEEFDLELQRINIDQLPELATQRGVRSIPTLILVNDEFEEIARHTGANTKTQVVANLGLTPA
jgi:thioredoxin-like negative regulator of GroEL